MSEVLPQRPSSGAEIIGRAPLAESPAMPFVRIDELESRERRDGWHGRHFHSASMTFGHWDFEAGASIHEHRHPQEEVWLPLEGELEVTVDGVTAVAGPGTAAIVPPDKPHSIRALVDGRAIVVDQPVRPDF